jgi:hypothetical protein
MANKNLFIYKLMNNPNARIEIYGLSKDIIAYTTQDFQFRFGTQWSGRNPVDSINSLNKVERVGTEVYNRTLGGSFGKISTGITLDIAGSALNYQGTDLFGFSINVYFIAIKASDDVKTKIAYLAEGVFPIFNESYSRIHPPNYYKFGDVNNIEGALSIKIGNWFLTRKIFIIDSLDFTVSKEVIQSGLPLYASGTILFKSVRVLSINEVKEMFRVT